jgi:hypothetical protein
VVTALTAPPGPHSGAFSLSLSRYRESTSKLIRVLRVFDGRLGEPLLSLDGSGRYLLLAGWNLVSRQTPTAGFVDLTTGKLTPVPGDAAISAASIAW